MSEKNFSVNIDADAVKSQYAQEQREPKKRTQYDAKNYLSVRLMPNENSKNLTIRLLPFSPEGGSPFKKVYMHTVKVNKGVSPSGWKTFVCPVHNKDEEGNLLGDDCPFCRTSAKAHELKFAAADEPEKKKYGDIEFLNRVKEMWIVRCIERDHEEDGVKFWLFNSSKKKDGVHDKIMNIATRRAEAAAKKGNNYSIFDLNNGLDLELTVTRTADGKTTMQIIDSGFPSPLTEDIELGEKWIHDPKKWDDVYTVKSSEFMEVIAMGGVPVYDKVLGKYVDKEEADNIRTEAEQQRVEENLSSPSRDFSEVVAATSNAGILNGDFIGSDPSAVSEDDDLPF